MSGRSVPPCTRPPPLLKDANMRHAEDQSSYRLRAQLGFKLSRAARAMQQRFEADLGQHGLTRLSWCVLSGVGLEGLTAPSDIAENMGIKRPTVSRVLKGMVKDGLIVSRLKAGDGRAKELALTRLGQDTLAACLPLVDRNARVIADRFTAEQLSALHASLDLLNLDTDGALDSL